MVQAEVLESFEQIRDVHIRHGRQQRRHQRAETQSELTCGGQPIRGQQRRDLVLAVRGVHQQHRQARGDG